jgi:hypothetical protein
MNGEKIEKKETITYGRGSGYQSGNGFEVVQSYAIVKNIVTDNVMQQWLNKNSSYPVGGMKAAYGTFLTALTTIWLSDKLSNANSPKYNVTWSRAKGTITMAGVNYMGGAYLHVSDVSMGMHITSNNESNVIGFRFINSMCIQEIENYVLSLTGLTTNSSLNNVVNAIDNLKFTMVRDGELMIISTEDGSNSSMVINTTSGLVKNLVESDGFVYKGVISSGVFWCFHNQLTNFFINGLTNAWNSLMSPVLSDFWDMGLGLSKFNITDNWAYVGGYIFDGVEVGAGILTLNVGLIALPISLGFVLVGEGLKGSLEKGGKYVTKATIGSDVPSVMRNAVNDYTTNYIMGTFWNNILDKLGYY